MTCWEWVGNGEYLIEGRLDFFKAIRTNLGCRLFCVKHMLYMDDKEAEQITDLFVPNYLDSEFYRRWYYIFDTLIFQNINIEYNAWRFSVLSKLVDLLLVKKHVISCVFQIRIIIIIIIIIILINTITQNSNYHKNQMTIFLTSAQPSLIQQ